MHKAIQRPNPPKPVSKSASFSSTIAIIAHRSVVLFIHILADVRISVKSRNDKEIINYIFLQICVSKFEAVSHLTPVSKNVAQNHLITELDMISEPALIWLENYFSHHTDNLVIKCVFSKYGLDKIDFYSKKTVFVPSTWGSYNSTIIRPQ